jgi:hypothetical protein
LRFRFDPIQHDLNVVARRRVGLNQPIGVSARVIRVCAADRDEPPLGQQRLNEGDAAERDSLTLQRRPDRLVILVVAKDALGLDRAQTHGMEPGGPLQPGAIRVVVFNENLFGDRIGVEPRYAERGMRDRRDHFAEQATRSRRRALGVAIANGDIRALGSQIHYLVVGRHAHVDIGMALLETAKARHDPQSGDTDAGGDRHRLAVAAGRERVDAILQLLKGAVGDAEEMFAFGGEVDRTIAAVEQFDAKRLLERDDLTADGGLGEEKIFAGQRMLMRRPTATKPRMRSSEGSRTGKFRMSFPHASSSILFERLPSVKDESYGCAVECVESHSLAACN